MRGQLFLSCCLRNAVRSSAFVTALMVPTIAPAQQPQLQVVQRFDHQVTGVAVSEDGRIFVTFPRWTEDTTLSVAELKNGNLVPFPNEEWNTWRNARKDQITSTDHWVCVQSVVADQLGHLWVLDPAAPALGTVIKDGPKLVEIDLKTNTPLRVIAFGETAAPQGSYLNDVRISPDGKTAYITDSGVKGAIIVVDLISGRVVGPSTAIPRRCLIEMSPSCTMANHCVGLMGAMRSLLPTA